MYNDPYAVGNGGGLSNYLGGPGSSYNATSSDPFGSLLSFLNNMNGGSNNSPPNTSSYQNALATNYGNFSTGAGNRPLTGTTSAQPQSPGMQLNPITGNISQAYTGPNVPVNSNGIPTSNPFISGGGTDWASVLTALSQSPNAQTERVPGWGTVYDTPLGQFVPGVGLLNGGGAIGVKDQDLAAGYMTDGIGDHQNDYG